MNVLILLIVLMGFVWILPEGMSVIALQTSSWIPLEWVVWVSKSYLKYYFRNHSQGDCFDANVGSKIEKLYFHMLHILLHCFPEVELSISDFLV